MATPLNGKDPSQSNTSWTQTHSKLESSPRLEPRLLKHSLEVDKNYSLAEKYSPEYKMKKFNHYDNKVKTATRIGYEVFRRRVSPEKEAEESCDAPNMMDTSSRTLKNSVSEVQLKREKAKQMKNYNHFNSNISNTIVEHKKIIQSKNLELDTRAYGLKDFGIQPFIGAQIDRQRAIDEIRFNSLTGRCSDENQIKYPKNFTPITAFMKNMKDAKIARGLGHHHFSFRSNLNVS